MTERAIYSLCLKNFPGANYALENLDRTCGMTRHIRLASTQHDGPEVEFIRELLRTQQPRVVLFGGWSGVYKALMQTLRDTSIHFAVYWTSSGGQTDISQEISKLAALLDMENPVLCFSSHGMARAFQSLNMPAFFMPLTLVEPAAPAFTKETHPCRISLFCPPAEYKRKNILNVLLALAQVSGDWQLVLNGLSQDASYAALLKQLRLSYLDWGWMERPEYEKNLWQIDLGLQLSFAESFDYVAAEHLMRGIPVLASAMVPVMDLLDDETRASLVITRADDVETIRAGIQALVDAPELRAELGARAQSRLRAANQGNITASRRVLLQLLETA